MKTMLNEPKKRQQQIFQCVIHIAIMLVATKLAMIHLNVPNVFDLYTIYSITHIGMYMRRLTATRLNQNVLRSVNFHSMTSMQIYMSLFTIKVFYELIMPGFLVHSQEWLLYSLDNQHTIWAYFHSCSTLPSIKIYFNMHQCLHYTISQYLNIHQFGITPMN